MAYTSKQIGTQLRDLRKKRGLTGEQTGRAAGISQSKLSKIETGAYRRYDSEEIERLLNILDAPRSISQRIMSSVISGKFGNTIAYRPTYDLEALTITRQAKEVRLYASYGVPSVLQTVPYRQALLAQNGFSEKEITNNLKLVMARQDLLWDKQDTVYHAIMPQAALYTSFTTPDTHRAQLDRLERMMDVRNIRIGIIPVQAGTVPIAHTSFAIYDQRLAVNVLLQQEAITQKQSEVALFTDIFDKLDALAWYKDEAAQLIRDAVASF